jgi:pyruvyltransferase
VTISAYWWVPTRPARTLAGEMVRHGRAWARMIQANRRVSNFGDAVNPLIIKELFGQPVEWAPLGSEDMVCIGSVLDNYIRLGGRGEVFGSGSRTGDVQAGAIDRTRIIGVRGRLTARSLGLAEDAAIGDPGLAVRSLIPVVPSHARTGPVVLPHFTDYVGERRKVILDLQRAGYDVVLPSSAPLDIAARIATADHVITSSLHAVVFADALEVPVARLGFERDVKTEPEFKYEDYRSVFGVPTPRVTATDVLHGGLSGSARDEMDAVVAAITPAVDGVVEGLFEHARSR